ncbi:DNA-binding transcriptional regulator, MarR family [Actinomadura meyerae]|uniref:DNA-binding transcriptional regulator, MarR family n=1 Tax=Actinomadura meyerae TaxID=240840 RepID=A0A239N849_9ACTN|nr:MarR family transcriptional regulator [Actinomadura meyerae]SNT50920.1 DNA-binding transcriptional regulator, MarR family [Actinomadura meyerae]
MDSTRSSATVEAYRLLIADVYQLAGLSRHTAEEIAREEGQSTARWHVLSVLSERPITVSAAARRLGLARQSVQRVVNELKDAGLVVASDNPDDARAPLVRLSDPGRETLARLDDAGGRHRSRLLAGTDLDEASLSQARTTIRQLIRMLSAPAPDEATR